MTREAGERFGNVVAQEDREWALRNGLEEINKEIEAASRNGVACWFPMGTRNERIVRLATKEAQLLNSRCAPALSTLATAPCPSRIECTTLNFC